MTFDSSQQPVAVGASPGRGRRIYYFIWVILKNIIGWGLILASGPIGLTLPGPGGLPLFLIGFAMISFPGKRGLTSRVLRGRAVRRNSRPGILVEIFAALLLPTVIVSILSIQFADEMQRHGSALVATVYAVAVVASWMAIRLALRLLNYGLTFVPGLRRKIRPWMRRKGIDLLPPRRRKRLSRLQALGRGEVPGGSEQDIDTGILEVDSRYQDGVKAFWNSAKPWLRRGVSVVSTALIFGWMIRKTARHWEQVKDHIGDISLANFIIAAFMFALFLFAVRAMSWRRIIRGFGHILPIAASVRVWATSELARYVPGVVMQVYGRVYLVKPYGVSATECAASQVLELVIFLLANILVGVVCLLFFGVRNVHGAARAWMLGLTAMTPLLVLIIHPRVFYGILDAVMRRRKKPAVAQRLSGAQLGRLLALAVVGLLWQNLAVFLIVAHPLGLAWAKWYVVSGAYCLAWCAGFLVITAPGGIGIREAVLAAALTFALPASARQRFPDQASFISFIAFLTVVLRLWTIAGEAIVTGAAYVMDYRGALGKSPEQIQNRAAGSRPVGV